MDFRAGQRVPEPCIQGLHGLQHHSGAALPHSSSREPLP